MIKMIWFLLGFLVFLANNLISATECSTGGPKIVCYYSSWAYYRADIGFFNTEHIDTSLCTHLIYTFAGLNLGFGLDSIDSNVDLQLSGMKNFTNLKQENPCLKTILAVGGWNEGSRKYSVMASTEGARLAFVESALRFLVSYNFDGLDVDWEYPGQRGGITEDRENFALLLNAMYDRFSKWGLEISIAAPIISTVLEVGYDVPEIAKYVEHVSLMAYDYTATKSKTTGLMAPLSEIAKSIDLWVREGFPREKLVLGLPSYARSYRLLVEDEHEIGALTNGIGRNGDFTNEKGFLGYYELQQLLQTGLYKIERHDGNCYAYYKNDWFSFDDTETYSQKINFAVKSGLGGIMLWTLDTDDFNGIFGTKYPLLNAIKAKLDSAYDRKYLKRN